MNISPNQPIKQRIRPDLLIERSQFEGRMSILVKDPVSLKYVRFQEEEFAILELLDGIRNLLDIQTEFEQRFAPRTIEFADILTFVSRLQSAGLLLSDAAGTGTKLQAAADQRRRHRMHSSISSIMYIKLPGVDPERFLRWLYPKCRWLYSGSGVFAALVVMLSAVTLVVVNFDEFQSRPELSHFQAFFNVYNIVWLWLALAIAKIIHEIGHGLTCLHFGGECHEMGVLFLVFSPCLYCDVSDAWMLPNKWHRIAISAAGIYVEILLAAIATFVWWHTAPGLIHNLAFGMLIVCSVSTIVFNANPLMRFDGYYVFSDWVEIPNLRQKANKLIRVFFTWLCLGVAPAAHPETTRSRTCLFTTYAVAAFAYRWVISAAVLMFLYTFLRPYNLSIIGHAMTALVLFTLIGMPIIQFTRFILSKQRTVPMKKRRIIWTCVVLAVLIGVAFTVPFPLQVSAVLTVEAADAEPVFANVSGSLTSISAKPGQRVESGTTLAELSNNMLPLEIEDLRRLIARHETAAETYRALDRLGAAQRSRHAIAEAKQQLDQRMQQEHQLHVTSPRSGVVIAASNVPTISKSESGQLPGWSGQPLDDKNLGSQTDYGTLLCYVGDTTKLEAILVIDQSEIEFVNEGDVVRMKFDAYPQVECEGTIAEVSLRESESTPLQHSTRTGGELATHQENSGRETTYEPTYQARVRLDKSKVLLRPGFRGRAKIKCGTQTCAQLLFRSLASLFRFSI